jgi:hypothetical protein
MMFIPVVLTQYVTTKQTESSRLRFGSMVTFLKREARWWLFRTVETCKLLDLGVVYRRTVYLLRTLHYLWPPPPFATWGGAMPRCQRPSYHGPFNFSSIKFPYPPVYSINWGKRKDAGSIPDYVTGIFYWHNPSCRTMALGSTQPLTEMI